LKHPIIEQSSLVRILIFRHDHYTHPREQRRPMYFNPRPLAPRHKVFLSYHHASDQAYKDQFASYFADAFDDYSVRNGDIDDNLPTERLRQIIRDQHIRDATVTVVLIGAGTWRRKHVDWEIDSSLRHTRLNSRTGLLGILLANYSLPPRWDGFRWRNWPTLHTEPALATYCPNNIPPRLWDNVANGFATIRPWPSSLSQLREWIDEAYQRRHRDPPPNLARDRFGANRSTDMVAWEPLVR